MTKPYPVSITVIRATGPINSCNTPYTFVGPSAFCSANALLRTWSKTAPKASFDKCDFTIKFSDDYEYQGRLDISEHSAPNLGHHVLSFVSFYAGLNRPEHLAQSDYEKMLTYVNVAHFLNILNNYDLTALGKLNTK